MLSIKTITATPDKTHFLKSGDIDFRNALQHFSLIGPSSAGRLTQGPFSSLFTRVLEGPKHCSIVEQNESVILPVFFEVTNQKEPSYLRFRQVRFYLCVLWKMATSIFVMPYSGAALFCRFPPPQKGAKGPSSLKVP